MKHWKIKESDGLILLAIDVAERSANILSKEVIGELNDIVSEIHSRETKPRGLVIYSGKSSGFIPGADILEFRDVRSAKEAEGFARYGQSTFNKISSLPFPTVAAIGGYCMGGGLELALACDYRIACDDEKTRLGLPEVLLGINPGFAGTIRLPKLIGALSALDMMLTGKALRAKAARKIGLVDEVVPKKNLLSMSLEYIKRHPKRKSLALVKRLPSLPLLRNITARVLRSKIRKKVNQKHYPAPYRIIDLWVRRADQPTEAESLGELMAGETSRNLVYLFLLREKLKREGRRALHRIKRVHVIGAGVMGADIAMWAAYKGFFVTFEDKSSEALTRAMKRAQVFFRKKLKDRYKIQEAMDRLMPDICGNGIKKSDLVIEAIVEKVEAKKLLFSEIERKALPNALFATNTSSIPLEVIAETLSDPSRLVGLHFFNPVAKMELLEIVRGKETSKEVLLRAKSFAVAISKLPLEVKSGPGFFVNRTLMPYIIEAAKMAEEGFPLGDIDASAVDFGMPMGPIMLSDAVGLDVCFLVAEEISDFLGFSIPKILRKMIEEGNLGRKSGKGFYEYQKNGKRRHLPEGKSDILLQKRLISKIVDEARICLKDGVVADRDAANVGAVFGTGFAPFRGGIFGRK
ncbi:MAG: 3-hydroxyacyl-CoA dehydrogenase NAD-binding domain-containing protein [Patescibacteria group bacterium]|nr:MAG: 3-hydroxyacyl-CoA dehydrogenase NAD-binding domain-containing protein [Patescibacteria group bacterium]